MRYRTTHDPVLRDVTLDVPPGTKVGIVGRTGAGKSSLILALFRIVNIEAGSIVIGGVDIATLPLARLRSRLAIVPQSPVLFSGTIRSNLCVGEASETGVPGVSPVPNSAYTAHSDAQLWAALAKVGIEPYVRGLALGLDAPVEEKGQNLSVGQRQLLCLARALLKDCRVLVMDEASSSCDPDTDLLIQATVRDIGSDVTILTIAHRLPTIIGFDRVVVMDKGRVMEYDEPHALLQRPASLFSDLVASTGVESATFLRAAAQAAHDARETARSTMAYAPRLGPLPTFATPQL